MSAWPSGIGAITLFVEDLAASKEFYLKVFGLPVIHEDADSAVFDFFRDPGGHIWEIGH